MKFTDAVGFSKLECFRQCPQKFKFQFIDKKKTKGSAAMERGSKMHENIESYLNGWTKDLIPENQSFQKELDVLKTKDYHAEQALGFNREWELLSDWFVKSTWLRVKMDAYYIEGAKGYAIDFKSGKYRIPSTDQVALYAVGLHAKHPELESVTAEYWYLDSGDVYTRLYTAAELLSLRKKFEQEFAPIYTEELWEPNPSNECRWCDFSKTKGGKCQY